MYSLVATFFCAFIVSISATCEDCFKDSSKHYCPELDLCTLDTSNCSIVIKRSLNCPRMPDSAFAYEDSFARDWVTPLVAAVYNEKPQRCFKNKVSFFTFNRVRSVNCSVEGPSTTCHGYTAYDLTNKWIVVSFAGTDGAVQMTDEVLSFLLKERVPFYNNGHIFKYFNDAFFHLWNGGMETDVRQLQYIYPQCKLLVIGHSMGASIASTLAAYVVKMGIYTPENIRLVTVGQPRTGDYEFAQWHDQTFPYSYRVVHHRDPVPHYPPSIGPDAVFHHRYEVWYNNDMKPGQPYTICPEADGFYCSNREISENNAEHLVYFDKNLPVWGGQGCP